MKFGETPVEDIKAKETEIEEARKDELGRIFKRPDVGFVKGKAQEEAIEKAEKEINDEYDAKLAALKTPVETVTPTDTKDIDKRRNKAYGSIQFNYSTDEGYYGVYTDAQGKEEIIESWDEKAIKAILKDKYDAEVAALQPQTGQVTKASELNLQKEDTVVVKEPIKDFAEKGDTLTVLKSDENSVSFTNNGKEKTLSLQELNKHTTTMDILKTEQAESTPEILDAIDKQTINETVDAFNTFMGDTDAIAAAIKEADAKSMSEIEKDLLDNLDC
jgi:hypothetical protein